MQVRKRNGFLENADVSKIVRAVERCCAGLDNVDPMRVASKTIGGLFNGASTKELDLLSIQTAASLISEEPEYSRLAARLLLGVIDKEVANQDIYSFSQSVTSSKQHGLVSEDLAKFVTENSRKLNDAIAPRNSDLFEYFGVRTVYDRYLLRNPETRDVLETPPYFFLRVACGLSRNVAEAIEFYRLLSEHEYMPSSPTLFNSGTRHAQMSSCYLLDSPADNLEAIYDKYKDVAMLSKFAGGIGLAFHRVRSRGSLIRATNGHSKGVVPWLKTLDSSVAAVNQGGKRKGACCVYLEPWHADIEEFLELRDNAGDNAQRTYNINLANWIPDLFMKRVEADGTWSLFDPKIVPHFPDLAGEAFASAYREAETKKLFVRQVKARELYARMIKVLAETGNGWMTFKDACNLKSNQTAEATNVVHLSNLCTEITEVSSKQETAVCNLGSINLAKHITDGAFDFAKLGNTVRVAVTFLDRVIDINFYPIAAARAANRRWRPVGLGVMGLQDLFFALRWPFDAPESRQLSKKIQEEIYYHALARSSRSCRRVRLASLICGNPRRARRFAIRFVGHHPGRSRPLEPTARPDPANRPAKFPAGGGSAHGDHRFHRGRLRVHRAAAFQSLQARDAFRRFPADQSLPGQRTQVSRAVDRRRPHPHQDGGRLGAAYFGNSARGSRNLPHDLGNSDAFADRHGRRPRRIHRPEPVAEPFRAEPQHRKTFIHVHVRVEKRSEDHLLPAFAPSHRNFEDHRAGVSP